MMTETAGVVDDDCSDRRLALPGRFVEGGPPDAAAGPRGKRLGQDHAPPFRLENCRVELRHAGQPVNQAVQIAAFVNEVDDVDPCIRFAKNDEMSALAAIAKPDSGPLALH